MARKKCESRRRDILAIARAAFLERGYSATSMAAIAALVGGSKGTLYGYFANKEALFGAVVQDLLDEHFLPVFEVLESQPNQSLEDVLGALALALGRFVVLPDAIASYRLAVAEAARFPAMGRTFFLSGPQRSYDFLAEWMARRIERGELRPQDPQLLARQFIALCKIGPNEEILLGSPIQPDDEQTRIIAQMAVSTFLAAHAVRSPG